MRVVHLCRRVSLLAVLLVIGVPIALRPSIASAFTCSPDALNYCASEIKELAQNLADGGTSTGSDTENQAEYSADSVEQSQEPTVNSLDPTSRLSSVSGWTGYVAAAIAGEQTPSVVAFPSQTIVNGFNSATASSLRSLALRDNWEDDGSCYGYATKPEGAYDEDNGTLYVSSDGYIQCDYNDGYIPDMTVTLQLTGYGPYSFTNTGQSRSCSTTNPCQVTDFRFFNLDCGQRGTYDHTAHLTGSWLDEAGQWHRVDYWAVHNKGRYWRDC
jgi:hypothetical protein